MFDRIDWVLHMGPVRTTASRIVGEPGGPDVDVEVGPWPSDHRGVVSTFRVAPAAPPAFVGVTGRLIDRGDPLKVWFGTRTAADRVAIVHAGDPAAAALLSQPTGGALHGDAGLPDGRPVPRGVRRGAGRCVRPGHGPHARVGEGTCREAVDRDDQAVVRAGRADRGALEERSGYALGLDRPVPGGRRGRPPASRQLLGWLLRKRLLPGLRVHAHRPLGPASRSTPDRAVPGRSSPARTRCASCSTTATGTSPGPSNSSSGRSQP